MRRLLILVFLLSSVVADDIYLNNGGYMLNVKILDQNEERSIVRYAGNTVIIPAAELSRVVQKKVAPELGITMNIVTLVLEPFTGDTQGFTTPGVIWPTSFDLKMIPVALLSLKFAYDAFSLLDDVEGFEDAEKELRRDRIIYSGIGVLSIGLGLESNSIELPPDSATVSTE